MSRAGAEFYKPDGTLIGYGLFEGTCAVMQPGIFETQQAAWDAYMPESDWQKTRECKAAHHPAEPCLLWNDYGGGSWWPGTFCPACRVVLGPYNCDDTYGIEVDGHPFRKTARE